VTELFKNPRFRFSHAAADSLQGHFSAQYTITSEADGLVFFCMTMDGQVK